VILVDDRAGSRDLVDHPPLDTLGELCRLESADVCFPGNGPGDDPVLIGIEVKSLDDLISSIDTGRLQGTQIPAMLAEYDVNWLLYHGTYRPGIQTPSLQTWRGQWRGYTLGKRPVPYGYLESFLLTLTAAGLHVKHVADARTASAWVGVLHRWWTKPWAKHRGFHAFDQSGAVSLMPGMTDEVHLRARVAAQLPGVGFTRAVAAARHFPTVHAMINATPAEWATIPGIGKVIAKAVEAAVRG
jgi:hypothetical protein